MEKQPLASLDGRLEDWAGHLNTYTTLVKEQGYSLGSVRKQVQLISNFLTWLRTRHTEIGSLDEAAVQRFLRYPQNAHRTRRSGTAALDRFLHLLREQGVIPPPKEQPLSPQQRLIKDYERYLLEERGLTRATAANNVPFADRFLSALSAKYRGSRLALSQLGAADVTDFVRQQTQKLSPGRAQLLVTALRSFLRYLLHQGKAPSRRRCSRTETCWSSEAQVSPAPPASSTARPRKCGR